MNINEAEKEEVAINKEEAENIDDLISKMEKVTIEKDWSDLSLFNMLSW